MEGSYLVSPGTEEPFIIGPGACVKFHLVREWKEREADIFVLRGLICNSPK